jgi:hypothetical protein
MGSGFHIVLDPVKADGTALFVKNTVSGPPVSIPRLAYTPRINQVKSRRIQLDRRTLRKLTHLVDAVYIPLQVGEATLAVRVAKEIDWARQKLLHAPGITLLDQVKVLIDGAPMHKPRFPMRKRSPGHIAQIGLVGFCKNSARPSQRGRSHCVIAFGVVQPNRDLVVIAAHHRFDKLFAPIHHFIGAGAVANQIATAENLIVVASSCLDNGMQGMQVGVDVTEDEVAQRSLFLSVCLDWGWLERSATIG